MEKHLILISHGIFCEELKKSTEMIMGQQDMIHAVPLLPSESADDFQKKLDMTLSGLKNYTVMTDLMGGTPCNVASKMLLNGASFDLYAGMNMPMVIGFLNNLLIGSQDDLANKAKENIHYVNDILFSDYSDDED